METCFQSTAPIGRFKIELWIKILEKKAANYKEIKQPYKAKEIFNCI